MSRKDWSNAFSTDTRAMQELSLVDTHRTLRHFFNGIALPVADWHKQLPRCLPAYRPSFEASAAQRSRDPMCRSMRFSGVFLAPCVLTSSARIFAVNVSGECMGLGGGSEGNFCLKSRRGAVHAQQGIAHHYPLATLAATPIEPFVSVPGKRSADSSLSLSTSSSPVHP